MKKERSFEQSLARLEEIVAEIESEELGLERQFELFSEGMALARLCDRKLTEVEKSVEVVLKDTDAGWETAAFEGGTDSGGGPGGPAGQERGTSRSPEPLGPWSGEDAENDDRE